MEQTIQHRKSEVQAVQKKISNLQTEFDRQSIHLLAKQTATADASKALFYQEQADLRVEIETQKHIIDRNNAKITEHENKLESLNGARGQLKYEIEREEIALTSTKQETDRLLRENSQLEASKDLLQSEIGELSGDRSQLQSEITDHEAVKMRLIEDIRALEAEYERDKLAKDENIAKLNASILDLSQNLDLIQEKERLIRTDLATWQRSLDEKDKNLRIRELKVEQGENKIVQNAGLLNL